MLVLALQRLVRRRRDPEVDQLRRPAAEHDVRRLHVAVDEAALVHDPQAGEELAADAAHLVGRQCGRCSARTSRSVRCRSSSSMTMKCAAPSLPES